MLSNLIVSFIGNADLESAGLLKRGGGAAPRERGEGPVRHVLHHLFSGTGALDPARTGMMLFDDNPSDGMRREFVAMLKRDSPALGLGALGIDRVPIELPDGPTDLDALYRAVWAKIPRGEHRPDHVLFNLSPGTPAMYATLLLAAHCLLPREAVRLYESARDGKVAQLNPPYVIATREIKGERSRPMRRIPAQARVTLLEHTVIDDPQVEAAYSVLYNCAVRVKHAKSAPTILLMGPVGSGKRHAALQFAAWSGGRVAEWRDPAAQAPDDTQIVLVPHLDAWPATALAKLSAWRINNPAIAVAGTFRTDLNPAAGLPGIARDGLLHAEIVYLPALSARMDIERIAEELAKQDGIWTGKIRERLNYEFLTDIYPQGLWDLKALLAGAADRSSSRHPEEAAYAEAGQTRDAGAALALLLEGYRTLAGLKFGKGRPGVEEVLRAMRTAVVRYACAQGRNQQAAAELLGCSRSAIGKWLDGDVDLAQWRTKLAAGQGDPP
jgi:hypothetical protein